jgi:hypothetical protein
MYLQNKEYATASLLICNYRRVPISTVIRSKTYSGYVKPRIIPNAIYNVTFVQQP